MKTLQVFLALLAVCLLGVLAAVLSLEGVGALLFGWIPFLNRVMPRMTVDWPSVAVGVVAVLLFLIGVHWLARSWQRAVNATRPSLPPWKWRWTLMFGCVVLLLFSAGISTIGIFHQTGWLLNEDPLFGESVFVPESSVNNLKSIAVGIHSFNDAEKTLPPGKPSRFGGRSKHGEFLHSWVTASLIHIPISTGGIDRSLPWNHPKNQQYFKSVLPVFINSGLRNAPYRDAQGYGLSHYAANEHVISDKISMGLQDISDGMANTLLIGEVNSQFKPWGDPENWRDPAIGLNRWPYGFGGPSDTGGVLFSTADACVHRVSDKISPTVLRALSTPQGGEKVPKEF